MDRGAWWATVHGTAGVRHDLATKPPPSFIYVYFWPHHGVCGILSPIGMHDLITPTGIEPLTSAVEASLCFPICLSLLKLASTESAIPSNHLILCCPLLLLPSVFPSIRIFSSESEYFIFEFFFFHSCVDGHLGCFRNLPAVNKVAMNIGVHVSFQITVFIFFGYIQPKEWH